MFPDLKGHTTVFVAFAVAMVISLLLTWLSAALAWRLGLFIQDGWLTLPESIPLDRLRWDWIASGLPWIDPLREMKADVEGVTNRLKSRTEISKARGRDWNDIEDELEAEETRIAERLGASSE